ncbi:MAG: dihydroorotate dehydrogenase electron transfer subunit [candidate division WOR-3 bacterium]|nr:dihydroorotate dehydrogenase electron transfer subunit [candidate division WOR-3 bacterium]
MNKIFWEKVKIKEKINFSKEIIGFWLITENIGKNSKMGQFIHIKINENSNLLLRRPFSIADVKDSEIFFIFRIVGKGTFLLSKLNKNDEIDILGPLGKAIEIPEEKDILIFGGGLGIAPLYLLSKTLIENKKNLFVILGAKNYEELILKEKFENLNLNKLIFCTEDGSYGIKGKVTDGIPQLIEKREFKIAYVSGPLEMLRKIKSMLEKRIKIYGFLEERMGCGVGLCACCAVPKIDGTYIHLCEEGPCLLLEEILL